MFYVQQSTALRCAGKEELQTSYAFPQPVQQISVAFALLLFSMKEVVRATWICTTQENSSFCFFKRQQNRSAEQNSLQ